MNIKSILLGLVCITLIFLSFNTLHPIQKTNTPANFYTLKTYNINTENKWATFRNEGNHKFFIHPGEVKPTKGILTFQNDANLLFDFSIKKGSKVGDIEFTIKKNNKEIEKLIVTTKKTGSLTIDVETGDKVEIIADKHGQTSADWGNLKISSKNTMYTIEKILIVFLWSMLFVYLYGKKHLYIAINSYMIFLLTIFAETLNFGRLEFHNVLTYTIMLFSLTFFFTFIYQEFSRLKKFKLATIVSFITAFIVYLIPLFFIIYALNFDHKVTKDILYAVFQSNSGESYEYISDYIGWKYIILFIFVTAITGLFLYKQEKKETEKIEKSLLLFIIITFFSISVVQFSQLRLPKFIKDGFETYKKELRLFRQVQEKRKAGEIVFHAAKKAKGQTYIFIIGESLNRRHMGLYGYLRDTTPKLSAMAKKGEFTVFRNAYSNHTHTVPVLSLALTEANQYNKKSYYDSLSIVDILKKADVETYWLTNQTIYGAWDNMISVIGTSADHLVAMNKHIGTQTRTDHLDGALINEVKKVLSKKTDKDRVIFVHLIGNHGSYASRYPHDTYTIYKNKLKESEFGTKASKVNAINAYDNSVVYNDYVVSSIFKEAQKDKSVLAVIYMSDHTDDVIDQLGHNSSKFTFYMTQIPMLAWFSDKFKKEYTHKYKNLLNRTNTLFSNDMLYDTLIGVFGIETDKYNSKYDFSSDKYELKPKDALTLHGTKHYIDKSNHIYWQKFNTQYLIDINQSNRVFPHHVDSVGKLRDIWNDGFRSFQVDTRFGDNNSTVFKVGHDDNVMGVSLEKFLSKVTPNDLQRVCLDFKNLSKENYQKALDRLEYLNKKYHLKDKLIIESGTTSQFYKVIGENGWHTSYYMPTDEIVKLLKDNNKAEMERLAKRISQQSRLQKLSALSFDQRLYPFVKRYLEQKLSDAIVYHVWYAPALKDVKFKEELMKNKLYEDKRVKTLLVPYDSQFNLCF